MSDKIVPISRNGIQLGWAFFCPACKHAHKFCTSNAHTPNWPIWTLTGMPDRPTVRASLLYSWNEGEQQIPKRCHSFITNGNIEFCMDCTHELAGKTVPIPDFPNNYNTTT